MKKKILLLEDDYSLGSTLKDRLNQTYQTDWAASLAEARGFLEKSNYDLAILDLGLPDGSGFDLAETLSQNNLTQFIFLTAQADASHRLRGFELGAAEFIPKPFHLKELLLRVQHVLKDHSHTDSEIELKNCRLSFAEQKITYTDGRIEFPTANDFKILRLLIKDSPQVISRDQIIDEIWGVDKVPSPRSIDNMIVRLRQLLETDQRHIRSVRGVGYQWLSTITDSDPSDSENE